jgi:hypothetical protein
MYLSHQRRNAMAKCPHCGKELEFTVIPRKPKAAAAARTAKARGTAPKTAAKPGSTIKPAPKAAPKRPLLKTPTF